MEKATPNLGTLETAGGTLRRLPRFDRLPSGRHQLDRQTVLASQRGRLVDAMVQVATEKGYPASTVADVVERAGVSRRTFYEQFADKEACFLEAYDTGASFMLGRLQEAVNAVPEEDWRGRARASVEAYVQVLAEEPAFSWALHIEVLAAGQVALNRRAEILDVFADVWHRFHQRAHQEDPSITLLSQEAVRVITAGLEDLVREVLRAEGKRDEAEFATSILKAAEPLVGKLT